jgi:hypothetical protein
MRIVLLAGLIAGVFVACAPPSTTRAARDPRVITREEILASHTTNAYDAVSMLRPNWLQFHGQTTITGSDTGYPKVYLNHILYGDLTSLNALDAFGVLEIHYYNGAEAQSRFGLGNVAGAIEVVLDPGSRK